MRKIYGCTKFHRIPSKTILNTLKAEYIRHNIERRRWNYVGHIVRYPDERWSRFLLTAIPTCRNKNRTRAPRRPRRQIWLDQVESRMMDLELDMEDDGQIFNWGIAKTNRTYWSDTMLKWIKKDRLTCKP